LWIFFGFETVLVLREIKKPLSLVAL